MRIGTIRADYFLYARCLSHNFLSLPVLRLQRLLGLQLQLVLGGSSSENDLEVEFVCEVLQHDVSCHPGKGAETYLQAFYFSLETKDEVLHVPAV